MVLIVCGRREELERLALEGTHWDETRTYFLRIAPREEMCRRTRAFCSLEPRIGGAWDGLSAGVDAQDNPFHDSNIRVTVSEIGQQGHRHAGLPGSHHLPLQERHASNIAKQPRLC